jgi:hypothetical protein
MAHFKIEHGGTHPQMEFWENPSRFRAFVGGVGSGKTRAGVVEVLRMPGSSRGCVVAPTYRMLQDATIHTFLEVTEQAGVLKDYKKSDMTALLHNGTEILFRSCDDPDKLRGPNLGWFWLDEAAMMPQMVWDLMIGRLRLGPGRAWVTTTPRGKNWMWKLFVRDGREDYHLTQCSSKTNTFLPSYFIKALEDKYSGHWLKQELEGAFVEFVEAAAYEDFKMKVNVIPHEEAAEMYDERRPIRLACDFNHLLMAWPVIQVINAQPVVICEISQHKKASIPVMVRKFRSRFPSHAGGLRVFPDASAGSSSAGGQSLLEIMEGEFTGYPSEPEFYVPPKNPRVPDRIHSVNQIMRGANLWKPLLIADSCEYLIEDFQRVQWNEPGTGLLKISDPDDDRALLTHATDALGYWVMMDMPSSFYIESVQDLRKIAGEERRYHGGLAGL